MKSLLLLLIIPVVLGIVFTPVCQVNYRKIRGEYAEEGEFPGVVYLNGTKRVWNDTNAHWNIDDYNYGCAGSLISDRWVLTAAHCVYPEAPYIFRSVRVYPAKGHPKSIESRIVIPHPGYPHSDDIALILLPQAMSSIYRNFKPVSLPVQGQNLTSNEITLVGWGVTSTTEEESLSKLMKLEHVQLNQTLCQFVHVNETEGLCRFSTESAGNTCQGDSGGPVFMDGLQVGVVSEAGPGLFFYQYVTKVTRVSAYRDWIDEMAGLNIS